MAVSWIDLGETSLRYEVAGHGPRVLVLLHEMGGALESWDHVVPKLEAEFQILRFDMRGSGMSQKINGQVTLDQLVDDLVGLLDHLGMTKSVSLAGCAVGAAVAIGFAARCPERVSALVAMAPALGVPPERRAFAMERADAVERDGMRPMTMAGHDRAYPFELRKDPVRELTARAIKLANDPHSFAAIQRMLAGLDMSAELKALSCRTLFLAGSLDGTRPPEQVQVIAAQVANSEYETVISGHGMGYLTPELIATKLADFLRY